MSIAKDTVIPGVSRNNVLQEWIEKNIIKLHPRLVIGKSELGGIGLQFEGVIDEELGEDEDLEVLRVPYDVTLDYMNLLPMLDGLKERDQNTSFEHQNVKESELIVNVLTVMEPHTETHILCCYVIAFYILRELSISGKYHLTSPLRIYDQYLDILLGTEVMGFPRKDESSDKFISSVIQEAQTCKFEYESFVESMNILYREKEIEFELILSFETFYQLSRAIRSRTLEIPHGIEQKDKEELEETFQELHIKEPDHDGKTATISNDKDFITNITLVPILDFANHFHNNNAYFDVDANSKAVLLKIKRSHLKHGKFEVTISYSPVESVGHFVRTYGFIPQIKTVNEVEQEEQVDHFQLLELYLQVEHEVLLKSKWLQIVPQVQLVLTPNDAYINLHDSNLPLLFDEDIQYNSKWPEVASAHFRRYNSIPDEVELDDAEIIDLLKHQEEAYDIINGVPPIGVTVKGEQITNDHAFDTTEEMITKCVAYIITLSRGLVNQKLSDDGCFGNVLDNVIELRNHTLQLLIRKHDSGKSILIPDHLAREEWSAYSTAPKQLALD
ncbi:uncharacterized protein CANTADRAFT_5316 [Suhomyces tanzawaensis NRRL Y-17324]|uniref:SET domain-containing protein n=1 Tax=Suhomyces tanzawaensis NRRL Y-17324 TaxID=984487 RepID=A0A1E4SJ99_9ASCO|nr:uncharacterized protein CANTADRAFT_5316 [Suhomyces tanzawaensis NRRL Y-17324]ODV79583.1 hypothetical protein CANTADRAFT_5316 [Suhomyces tanzawaensis NRRL Y-17324]